MIEFSSRRSLKVECVLLSLFLVVFCIILLFPSTVCHASTERPKEFPQSLLVVTDASELRYYTLEGTQQVNYRVKICYPGSKVLGELSDRMKQKAWILLNEDFLNPGIKSNYVRGEWSTFWDEKGNYIYQWISDWKDTAGNVIRYNLRYVARDKQNSEKNCDMDVYGVYFPKKILEETLPRLPARER